MKLSQLFANCDVKIKAADITKDIISVVSSSDKVTPGALFIALKGTKNDGLSMARDAVRRGCSCILSDRDIPGGIGVPMILCEDARKTTSLVYSNFYGNPDRGMRIIAITGTNGKTTTALTLEHILKSAGRRVGVIGTLGLNMPSGPVLKPEEAFEYNMTTPDPELLYRALAKMRDDGCDTVVAEASSHALSFKKLDGLHIDVGAFTNLTPEHMDFHLNMEDYYKAKSRLCSMSKIFFANADDLYGRRMMSEFSNVRGFSCIPESAADESVFSTAVMYRERGFEGIGYLFYGKNCVFEVKSPMWGKNALYNTMLASSVALCEGVDAYTVRRAVESFTGVKGRLEPVCFRRGAAKAIIDYAHTPDALEKTLLTVRSLMRGRGKLILVFGCGGDRDTEKRAVMGNIACRLADFSFVTSDNPRGEDPERIISMIEAGFFDFSKYCKVTDRREAIRLAVAHSTHRDVILVCGKGHEEYIIDGSGKHFFPEREIIKTAILEKFFGG